MNLEYCERQYMHCVLITHLASEKKSLLLLLLLVSCFCCFFIYVELLILQKFVIEVQNIVEEVQNFCYLAVAVLFLLFNQFYSSYHCSSCIAIVLIVALVPFIDLEVVAAISMISIPFPSIPTCISFHLHAAENDLHFPPFHMLLQIVTCYLLVSTFQIEFDKNHY